MNNQGRASALWPLLVLRLGCAVRYNSTSLYVLYVDKTYVDATKYADDYKSADGAGATMYVDYVRVYEPKTEADKPAQSETPAPTPTPTLTQPEPSVTPAPVQTEKPVPTTTPTPVQPKPELSAPTQSAQPAKPQPKKLSVDRKVTTIVYSRYGYYHLAGFA